MTLTILIHPYPILVTARDCTALAWEVLLGVALHFVNGLYHVISLYLPSSTWNMPSGYLGHHGYTMTHGHYGVKPG